MSKGTADRGARPSDAKAKRAFASRKFLISQAEAQRSAPGLGLVTQSLLL
jgi:hypothetical protein